MILKDAMARCGVLSGILATVLGGCAAGPDFRSPAPPAVEGYRKDPLPAATVETNAPTGDAQRFVNGADVPAQWLTAGELGAVHWLPLDRALLPAVRALLEGRGEG